MSRDEYDQSEFLTEREDTEWGLWGLCPPGTWLHIDTELTKASHKRLRAGSVTYSVCWTEMVGVRR